MELRVSDEQGLVEAVGVSNYGPKQLQKIAGHLRKRDVPLVTAQVRWLRQCVDCPGVGAAVELRMLFGPQ